MASQVASEPRRKNPVLRTPLPTLPPGKRSRAALGLTAAAARGRLELQVCQDCGATQYPPREVCGACLSHRLIWRPQDGRGELMTETMLRTAQELFFRERIPWRIGTVRLDAGVNVIAFVHERVGSRAMPRARRGRARPRRSRRAGGACRSTEQPICRRMPRCAR